MNHEAAQSEPGNDNSKLKEAEQKTAEEHKNKTDENNKRQQDDTYVAEEIGVKP